MVKVVQIVIECPGDGIKQLGEDIRDLFNEKKNSKLWEIKKVCHMGKRIHSSKIYVRSDKLNVFKIATETC